MDDEVLRVYLHRMKDLDEVGIPDTINIVEKVPYTVLCPFYCRMMRREKMIQILKSRRKIVTICFLLGNITHLLLSCINALNVMDSDYT
jgi:hypothetical protein